MMQMHLDEISQQVKENAHAITLMDRASWHTTEALVKTFASAVRVVSKSDPAPL